MSVNDQVLLDTLVERRKAEVAPDTSTHQFFQLYATEQVLKNFAPSYEEIDAGDVDGGNDGGFDGIYCYLDGTYVDDDTTGDSVRHGADLHLYVIQTKNAGTFNGTAVDKFTTNLPLLLDLTRSARDLGAEFNEDVLRIVENFRRVYSDAAARFPRVRIHCLYVSRSPEDPHPNVASRAAQVCEALQRLFPDADAAFQFLGARQLVELSREQATSARLLTIAEQMSSERGGTVALVRLPDYEDFITDTSGQLLSGLFESNVRDYQGPVEVNRGIKSTLENPANEDFWWLNNGITIVSSRTTLAGKTLTIENPQVVNGLQTSIEIHSHFKELPRHVAQADRRLLLARVVPATDEASRDRVIRATNSQTSIPTASLRATDDIQHDIEQFLRHHQLYYDRRKNEHKNAGRPRESIVSITYAAQALASIMLGKPDFARARPSTLIKADEDYARLFSASYPMMLYLVAIRIQRRVDVFLKGDERLATAAARNNVRFHVSMALSIRLTETEQPRVDELASIDVLQATDGLIDECLADVLAARSELLRRGAGSASDDQAAKSAELVPLIRGRVVERIAAR